MNPFQLKPEKETEAFMNWQQLYPRSYDKLAVDPYTRVRVILMNGTEFEAAGAFHAGPPGTAAAKEDRVPQAHG